MVRTYDPKQVTLALGSHIITGYADDSFIEISPSGDGITKKVGCDGEVERAVTPDDTFLVKLTLLQTSPSNSFLQERYKYDRQTGDGLLPILIKDLRGGLVFSSEAAWVTKDAVRVRGKEGNNNAWEIDTGNGNLTE